MNQQKIGSFLKELRKEKNLTQEQLAEYLNTSRRTISRWETGNNLPDLDILIELSDYYDVELRELIDGERKSEQMDRELKETVLKVADYSNEEKQVIMKRMNWIFIAGTILSVVFLIMLSLEPANPSHLYKFIEGVCVGVLSGCCILGVLLTSKYAYKFYSFKKKILNQ